MSDKHRTIMSKYGAKKTVVGGLTFDSRAEARRWADLLLLQKAGAISGLQRQVAYELAPKVRLEGSTRAKPALRYVADFHYWDVQAGKLVVEDTKGVLTDVFRVKQHLMATVHGIHVRVTA